MMINSQSWIIKIVPGNVASNGLGCSGGSSRLEIARVDMGTAMESYRHFGARWVL